MISVLSAEVELLVLSHECHTLACNMEGISAVLRASRAITTSLAELDSYSLMVRGEYGTVVKRITKFMVEINHFTVSG